VTLTACTICAGNYLPYARVLAASFYAHHPDGAFTVLLVDDEERRFAPEDDRIDWRRLRDIGLDPPEIRRLAGIYDVRELCTAVKPMLLRSLLDEGRETVMYLDPDIRVYQSLEEIRGLAARHGIVLTPHTTQAFPRDACPVDSFYILAAGVYNLGFIGIGASARPFLDWWWQSTRREALNDVQRMMFTDQRWIDLVPCLFDPYILKDPGYNVAYWNLHARTLEADGDRYTVDGLPLRFFHFSGFDVEKPWLLSRHQGEQPRVLLSERPALRRICDAYRSALLDAGFDSASRCRYGWSTLGSGLELTDTMRRLYRSALIEAEGGKAPEPPDPFDESDPDAFLRWLNTPDEKGPPRVSRYLHQLYRNRVDLQVGFPDIHGADASRYLEWVRRDGVVQARIPSPLLPPPPAAAPPSSGTESRSLTEGVNIAGYFRSELGIGEAARLLVSALKAARIPYSTITNGETLSRQSHEFENHPAGVAAYDINVLCVNADMTPRFARRAGPELFQGRYTAGYWFWEIERFPPALHAAFDVVDEVWAATDFVAAAVRTAGGKPVFTVPVPVPAPRCSPGITRARLGLPDRFLFLLSFDFLSIMERKNPVGLIRAFRSAFAAGEGPVLLLKSINGHLRLNDLERLRDEAGGRPDVLIVDRYYSAEEKDALPGLCDCYVSLHRSEGLGLTMAEAMAAGKPVIATGYSGNRHFMTPTNSYLVDYAMGAVPEGCDPYPPGAAWAEPDIEHAARLMRDVYERPQDAAARGKRAQAEILERHGVEASAAAIARRLEAIRRDRRRRVVVPPAAPADAAATLEAALPRLARFSTPHVSVDGRGFPWLRTAAQRGLFRLARPLWFQQRELHSELIGLISQLVRDLQAEREHRAASDALLARLEGELAAAKRELGRIDVRVGRALEDRAREVSDERQWVRRELQGVPALRDRVEALTGEVAALRASWASSFTNVATHLEGLTGVVGRTEGSLATLERKLFALPYMADPGHFREHDENGGERLGYRARDHGTPAAFYLGFEDLFRGPQTLVRERQAVYLPLLRHSSQVVDIGCGRGEMLDLLAGAQTPAIGVEIDPDMVALCRAKGHRVEQMDALQFLREQGERSLADLFSAQVIEHLTFEQLKAFLTLCRSRLRPGGTLIVETVNPHALEAFKTFYTDLTHQRPIFPEVALALTQLVGFDRAHVLFPLGTGVLDHDRQSQGEYAVIASVAG
jgi:glycosyltransferase involved in cell wall biosynthesis/2-polyprenyl-3-methyl-5-hydroxy-6-metoxy-1,4-benzoquinol methylase